MEVLKMKWLVLSLYQPGTLKMLVEQLHRNKLDITGIQEMRCMGEEVIEKNNNIVFYSCQRRDHIQWIPVNRVTS
jgi:hypothetical protein